MIRLQHVSLPIPPGGQEQGREFYGGIVGLSEKQPPAVLAPSGVVWFDAGDGDRELHLVPDPGGLTPAAKRHFCFEVDDVARVRARFDEGGVETFDQAVIPNRPRFFCRDPFGNLIEVLAVEGPYS